MVALMKMMRPPVPDGETKAGQLVCLVGVGMGMGSGVTGFAVGEVPAG